MQPTQVNKPAQQVSDTLALGTSHINQLRTKLNQTYAARYESLPKPNTPPKDENLASHTPVSKRDNAFKSPAPSSKKFLSLHHIKSPNLPFQQKGNASNSKGRQGNSENWMISPVCSRLRDHIQMMNGNSLKERLFLQSPLQNPVPWPLQSPAINNQRGIALGSTAPNTSTCQKYGESGGTQERYSGRKTSGRMDSPLVVRKFVDPENLQSGLLAELSQNLSKSVGK